jgi:hypothetical protein
MSDFAGEDDQMAPLPAGIRGPSGAVDVLGAVHLLPLEKAQTTASHIVSFIRQFDGK